MIYFFLFFDIFLKKHTGVISGSVSGSTIDKKTKSTKSTKSASGVRSGVNGIRGVVGVGSSLISGVVNDLVAPDGNRRSNNGGHANGACIKIEK